MHKENKRPEITFEEMQQKRKLDANQSEDCSRIGFRDFVYVLRCVEARHITWKDKKDNQGPSEAQDPVSTESSAKEKLGGKTKIIRTTSSSEVNNTK